MKTLKMGCAMFWRIKPSCSDCAKGGHDFRCDCRGTGVYLHCGICNKVCTSLWTDKGPLKAFHVDAGDLLDCDLCSDACKEVAQERCIEHQLRVQHVAGYEPDREFGWAS